MKVLSLSQPYASLLVGGAISTVSSVWGVKPGACFVAAAPAWSPGMWEHALDWKVVIRALGFKSRSLMPVGVILGTAIVEENDFLYKGDGLDLAGCDADVRLELPGWVIRASNPRILTTPAPYPDSRPTSTLTKTAFRSMLDLESRPVVQWGSLDFSPD